MSRRVLSKALCALVFATVLSFSLRASATGLTTADCLSANEQSIALRNTARLRAARTQTLVCADPSCPADVRTECVRRISEVNAAIPTLVFAVKDRLGTDLSVVKVTMDGETIAEQLDGTSISLDPGAHTFVFEAAGEPPLTKQMVIREGEKNRRELVQFGSPPPAAVVPLPSDAPAETPLSASPSRGLGMQRGFAIAAAGVGVAGIVVGTVFGLESMSKHDDATKICTGACDSNGVTLWNQARSAGDWSTVGFVVGVAGLAGGVALWLTASGPDESRAQVGLGPGSVHVRAVW